MASIEDTPPAVLIPYVHHGIILRRDRIRHVRGPTRDAPCRRRVPQSQQARRVVAIQVSILAD